MTTFTNGFGDEVYAKLNPPSNNALIGFSNHLFPSLIRMWPPPSPSLKKNPSVRLNSLNSFIHNQDTYIWYYLTPWNPCHSAKTNLGCITQQMNWLVPLHTTIDTSNNHLCMEHLNIIQYISRNNNLRKNFPGALCGVYGHYTHHFPQIIDFKWMK